MTAKSEQNPRSKLTEKQVRKAHALYMKGLTTREVAEQVGAPPDAIGHVRGGTTWKHLGLGPVPARARARPGGRSKAAKKTNKKH